MASTNERTITLTEEEIVLLRTMLTTDHDQLEECLVDAERTGIESEYFRVLSQIALMESIQYKIKELQVPENYPETVKFEEFMFKELELQGPKGKFELPLGRIGDIIHELIGEYEHGSADLNEKTGLSLTMYREVAQDILQSIVEMEAPRTDEDFGEE